MRTRVNQGEIDFMLKTSSWHVAKMGDKTCVVTCRLQSGFEITESASCVNPANYDPDVGEALARKRVENRLWELEGYRLQMDIAKSQIESARPG